MPTADELKILRNFGKISLCGIDEISSWPATCYFHLLRHSWLTLVQKADQYSMDEASMEITVTKDRLRTIQETETMEGHHMIRVKSHNRNLLRGNTSGRGSPLAPLSP